MKNLLKELVLDFQKQQSEPWIRRALRYELLAGKACICIGVRRCGKTTFLHQIIDDLLKTGVSRDNILYINFFDERLRLLTAEKLDLVLEAYYSLYPQKKALEKIYCFFDEIQDIDGWEGFIDRILRSEKCEVFISGSSANLLSKEIATQMRGRGIAWELFPFSFAEFLRAQNIDSSTMTSRNRYLITNAFEHYFRIGGFPEVLTVSDRLRVKIHQEYFHSILHRDIIERHDVNHPLALIDAARWMFRNAGSLFSINRLTEHLRSNNHPVNKAITSSYVNWFEDSYVLFEMKIFNSSVAIQNANPRKCYCIDHALLRSVDSSFLLNSGHFLENMVFIHLRSSGIHCHYYRTRSGKEIDFVWIDELRKKHLVQVCYSLANPATKKREIDALRVAMEELSENSAILVTFDESGEEHFEDQTIRIVPAWKWLTGE